MIFAVSSEGAPIGGYTHRKSQPVERNSLRKHELTAEAYGVRDANERQSRIGNCWSFNLWDRRNDKVATFVKGMKQACDYSCYGT